MGKSWRVAAVRLGGVAGWRGGGVATGLREVLVITVCWGGFFPGGNSFCQKNNFVCLTVATGVMQAIIKNDSLVKFLQLVIGPRWPESNPDWRAAERGLGRSKEAESQAGRRAGKNCRWLTLLQARTSFKTLFTDHMSVADDPFGWLDTFRNSDAPQISRFLRVLTRRISAPVKTNVARSCHTMAKVCHPMARSCHSFAIVLP